MSSTGLNAHTAEKKVFIGKSGKSGKSVESGGQKCTTRAGRRSAKLSILRAGHVQDNG